MQRGFISYGPLVYSSYRILPGGPLQCMVYILSPSSWAIHCACTIERRLGANQLDLGIAISYSKRHISSARVVQIYSEIVNVIRDNHSLADMVSA
jgi:hypothetical protein